MFAIQSLNENHLDSLIGRFEGGADKFVRYMQHHLSGERDVLVAEKSSDGSVIGYITLLKDSEYPLFERTKCPEIVDLIVAPECRGKGVGGALLTAVEELTRLQGKTKIGLGVGLGHEYGPAQRLYTTRGYIADGNGLQNNGERSSEGDSVVLSEHTLLMMIKDL